MENAVIIRKASGDWIDQEGHARSGKFWEVKSGDVVYRLTGGKSRDWVIENAQHQFGFDADIFERVA